MPFENDCLNSTSRIREHYGMLSNQEKRVADVLLTAKTDFRSLTANSLAEKACVSGPTVIRFCRSIGFKGFTDYKAYVLDQMNRPEATWESFNDDDDPESVIQKAFSFSRSAMSDTVQMLNVEDICKAVDMFLSAKRIFVFAGGGAGSTALAMTDAFLQIGIPCTTAHDSMFQIMSANILGKDDLAVGISHSGRTKIVIDAMNTARQSGAMTMAIVGLVGSPVSKFADLVLYTGLGETSYFSKTLASRLCELQVVATLYTLVSLRRKEKIEEYQKHLNQFMEPLFQ